MFAAIPSKNNLRTNEAEKLEKLLTAGIKEKMKSNIKKVFFIQLCSQSTSSLITLFLRTQPSDLPKLEGQAKNNLRLSSDTLFTANPTGKIVIFTPFQVFIELCQIRSEIRPDSLFIFT